jgi:NADPH:quinone reductase-like Zn-dependent oxidoreductase
MPVRDNIVPLSDGAGEVMELGAGVTRVKVRDKVAGCFFQRWSGGQPPPNVQANALGGSIDGMLAEYVVFGNVVAHDRFSGTLSCGCR